jgi:hypothetical protein
MSFVRGLQRFLNTCERMGVRGKRVYMGIWFGFAYGVVFLLSTLLILVVGQVQGGDLLLLVIANALTILASCIVTRMLIRWRVGIKGGASVRRLDP